MTERLKLANRKRLTVKLNILDALASDLLFCRENYSKNDLMTKSRELEDRCKQLESFHEEMCHSENGPWWKKVGRYRTRCVLTYCEAALNLGKRHRDISIEHVQRLLEEMPSIPVERFTEKSRAHLAVALHNLNIDKKEALMHAKLAAFIMDERTASMTHRDKQIRAIAEWVRFRLEKDRKKHLQKRVRAIFGITAEEDFVDHPLYVE
jgi:exopolyphosphatase/pppGpp-phosphohydrolase